MVKTTERDSSVRILPGLKRYVMIWPQMTHLWRNHNIVGSLEYGWSEARCPLPSRPLALEPVASKITTTPYTI